MSDDDLSEYDSLDKILSSLETIESFPELYWFPEKFLANAVTDFVRALAPYIEADETVIKSDAVGLEALARGLDGKPLAVPLDDLILRFGRAAILRMAKSREPNKAFGFTREKPGGGKNPFRKRVEAVAIAMFVERERRRGRSIDVAIERAAESLKRPMSKRTAYSRLNLVTETTSHPNDIRKALTEAFADMSNAELDEEVSRFFPC